MIKFEPKPFLSGVYDCTDPIGSARPIFFEARVQLNGESEEYMRAMIRDQLERTLSKQANSHCIVCPRRKLHSEDFIHSLERKTRTFCEAPCLVDSEVVTLYVNGREQQKFLISYPAPYYFYKVVHSIFTAFHYENNLRDEWRDLLRERDAVFKGERWVVSVAEIHNNFRGSFETDPELLVRVNNGLRSDNEGSVLALKNLLEDQRLQEELDELEDFVELEALQGGVPLMGTFA